MDQLPALGKEIFKVIAPTYKIYGEVLQKRASIIKSTHRKTFSYGSDPRQNLDIYYPSSKQSGAKCPILVFFYGGGLVTGSKIVSGVENGLVYANLGHFFAEKHGYVVAIPDYRLVPHARFPSGGQDVALAIDWLRSNLNELGGLEEGTRDLFIMGNSAGGVHLCTYLFSPIFAELRQQVIGQGIESALRLRGAVLLSVPLHFEGADATRSQVLKTYYGDRILEDSPLGLFKSVSQREDVSKALPGVKFLILTGTLDPDEILIPNKDFIDAWNTVGTSLAPELQVEVMDGQNHISPPLSLATGNAEDEAWGSQVVEFFALANGD